MSQFPWYGLPATLVLFRYNIPVTNITYARPCTLQLIGGITNTMFWSSFDARPWNTILFPPPVGATITMSCLQSIWVMAIPCQSHNWSCRLLNGLTIAWEASYIYLASLIDFWIAAHSLCLTYLLMVEQVIITQGAHTKWTSMGAITDPPLCISTIVTAQCFLAFWLNTCHLQTTRTVGDSARLLPIMESIAWNPTGGPSALYILPIFACLCFNTSIGQNWMLVFVFPLSDEALWRILYRS